MRAAALLALPLLILLFSGCADEDPTRFAADADANGDGQSGQGDHVNHDMDATNDGDPMTETEETEPIVLAGELVAVAGGCLLSAELRESLPETARSTVAVPEEAEGRNYDGPNVEGGILNGGELCVVWELSDGTLVEGEGEVPERAKTVKVYGEGHASISWVLTIE